MLENIAIGQYIPGNSWIYKLDPRVKILLTFFLMAIIFVIPTIYSLLVFLGIFVVMFLTTGIPPMKMLKGMKPIFYLVIFTFILQLIYRKEGKLLVTIDFSLSLYTSLIIVVILGVYILTKKFIPFKMIYLLLMIVSVFLVQHFLVFDKFEFLNYSLKVYRGGLENGAYIALRVVLMISITSLLTFTTMNMDINNGLSSLLSPLKLLKIPVGIFSMMLSLTLRLIPTLLSETKKIMNAQSSRGVDFSEGNLKEKVTQIISLIVPMFVLSFKRAEDLSNAMISRGYEIDGKRTQYDKLTLKYYDFIAIFLVLLALGGAIYYRVAF